MSQPPTPADTLCPTISHTFQPFRRPDRIPTDLLYSLSVPPDSIPNGPSHPYQYIPVPNSRRDSLLDQRPLQPAEQNSSPKLGQRLIATPELTQLSTRTPDRASVLRPLSLFWCYLHSISNLFSHRHHHFPVPNSYTDSLMDQRPSRPQEIQIGLLITDLLYSLGAFLTPSQMPLQLLNAM